MSLLANTESRIPVGFAVKRALHGGVNGNNTALLPQTLWRTLSHSQANRVCLSIAPTHSADSQSFVCWAVPADNVEHVAEVLVPPEWFREYPQIFSNCARFPTPLTIAVVQPVPLTNIVVTALSRHSYTFASSFDSVFEAWLSDGCPILRQGSIHFFSPALLPTNARHIDARKLCFRLDLTEPVMQGYFQIGLTRLLLTLQHNVDPPNTIIRPPFESNMDSVEIGEEFLAGSVLRPRANSPANCLSLAQSSDFITPSITAAPEMYPGSSYTFVFKSQPLQKPPRSEESSLFLRTTDLWKMGLMSGDWAIAGPASGSTFRLVRVIAGDDLIQKIGTVAGSPLLLYNISRETGLNRNIILQSCPIDYRNPVLPTARTLTVARVASPMSTNRAYQPLLLHGLKEYFSQGKVLVRKGDLIGIAFDTDLVRWHHEAEMPLYDPLSADELPSSQNSTCCCPDQVIFFVVADVEYNMPPDDAKSQDLCPRSSPQNLGYWVDPTITKIIQTGLVHSHVPDITNYLGLARQPDKAIDSALLALDSPFRQLWSFVHAVFAAHAMDNGLQLSVMLSGARGVGKFTVIQQVAQSLGLHLLELNCYRLLGDDDVKSESKLKAHFEQAALSSPCILILRHVDALVQTTHAVENTKDTTLSRVLQDGIIKLQDVWRSSGHPVILIGTTSDSTHLSVSIQSCFKYEIKLLAPNDAERHRLHQALLDHSVLAPDISLPVLTMQTAAFVASDIVDLIAHAKLASIQHVICELSSQAIEHDGLLAGLSLTAADFICGLDKTHLSYSESIGAPKIPAVSWDDVGGLIQVKTEVLETVQLPLDHPELFTYGFKKRSGLLLYGPPGTGKTLVAKAVATTCSLNFLSVKGPELLNMYIGESEANVRQIFQQARDARPCIIFFDELDSIAPKRGNQGDSGGVMDRIVSQLLAELDGMSGEKELNIFIIAATNRPDLLDPALLRPGRLDRMLYLDISKTHQAQVDILKALTRKLQLDPTFSLQELAKICPFNYTGADFYALCSDALLIAMSRKIKELDSKIALLNALPKQDYPYPLTPQYYLAELAADNEIEIILIESDFKQALQSLVPSVSEAELQHYSRIQEQFSFKIFNK